MGDRSDLVRGLLRGDETNTEDTFSALAMNMHMRHMQETDIDPTDDLADLHNMQMNALNNEGNTTKMTSADKDAVLSRMEEQQRMRRQRQIESERNIQTSSGVSSNDYMQRTLSSMESLERSYVSDQDTVRDYMTSAFRQEKGMSHTPVSGVNNGGIKSTQQITSQNNISQTNQRQTNQRQTNTRQTSYREKYGYDETADPFIVEEPRGHNSSNQSQLQSQSQSQPRFNQERSERGVSDERINSIRPVSSGQRMMRLRSERS